MTRLIGLLILAGMTPLAVFARTASYPPPVLARHAMVVTAERQATRVGLAVLRSGGNAVDAAVAVGYALAVTDPCCGNLGGGGFMIYRPAHGAARFLDFREVAPQAATPDLYLNRKGEPIPGLSLYSWKAIGVPGTVAGLEEARRLWGTWPRARLLAPAIRLARLGFVLSPDDAKLLAGDARRLAQDPYAVRIFFSHGRPLGAGALLRQPTLAKTLARIARGGARAFYEGPIARAIVKASRRHGGILSLADFLDYRPVVTRPLRCRYRGVEVLTAPPPGGGATLCEMLDILRGYPLGRYGFHSALSVHFITEAMRWAYADRNTFLGDPAFVRMPLRRLLSQAYARSIRKRIAPRRATPSADVRPGITLDHEGHDTTQYSIVDRFGNAVSVTYTLNTFFGTGFMAPHTGFFLNNEMDDFTTAPDHPNAYGLVQGPVNAIAPGKRPLSSMTPTIVTRKGRLFIVTGSPGGSTITTTVLQVILNLVDYHLGASAAVDAPRFHMQWQPDVIYYEPGAFSKRTMDQLRDWGYRFRAGSPWGSRSWGDAESVIVTPSGWLEGVNDLRYPAGLALGD
ncbi:MAG: gamma-glutamyltransferase [Gammaproteobacteria bacterium]